MSFFRAASITDWINIYLVIKDTQHKKKASGLNTWFPASLRKIWPNAPRPKYLLRQRKWGMVFTYDLTSQNAFKSPTIRIVNALEIGWLYCECR